MLNRAAAGSLEMNRKTSAIDDEAELVARARLDRQAFAPLYNRYLPSVYRYCYGRVGSREAAEDLTSLVFAKALAALPTYRGGSFAAWLFTIARNAVSNASRRAPDRSLTDIDVIDAAPMHCTTGRSPAWCRPRTVGTCTSMARCRPRTRPMCHRPDCGGSTRQR